MSTPPVNPDEVAIIIPARMAATRLPGKPLAMLGDAPMIVHVMGRAAESGFGRVVVATDDKAIADTVKATGGEAVLTRPDHPSGSDRVAGALEIIDPDGAIKIAVNVQGDLPELDGGILPPLVEALVESGADIATPFALATDDEAGRDSVVKAAITFDGEPKTGSVGRVLYFSRNAIPHGGAPLWHHIGIYAWRREALARFITLPPSPLEESERLEQLRALEDGMAITALIVDSAPGGIDTADDLKAAAARFENSNSKA